MGTSTPARYEGTQLKNAQISCHNRGMEYCHLVDHIDIFFHRNGHIDCDDYGH